MKNFLPALFLFSLLLGCKNGDNNSTDSEYDSGKTSSETKTDTSTFNSKEDNSTSEDKNNTNKDNAEIEDPDREISSENPEKKNSGKVSAISGNFIKVGEENDADCSCYCLEVVFNAPSEMCLTPNKMYVMVNYKKGDGNVINVHLVDPSSKNTEGADIPWKDFDRTVPIATITPKSNGEMDLDWLGFTINGDLAMDYALFGKKTLEGQYRKK